jgi:CelD/BcsL family acetyltransferase involved in cellulose biosynthesis
VTWFEVARTFAEVEAVRPTWRSLQSPFITSDLDFVLTYIRNAAGKGRPHAVVVGPSRDEPTGLISCRVEEVDLPARLGTKVVLEPRVRSLTVTYGGFMGPVDDQAASPLLEALSGSVEPGEVDVVRLRMLRVGSPLHAAATDRAQLLRRQRFQTRVLHWRAELPDSLDDYLAGRSKRRRESVRRYSRRLERTYGDEMHVEVYRDRDGIDRLFADSALVHRETYQHVLGVGFSEERVQRALTELAMDRGWFRGYVLYLRDRPAAFWHGNAYAGVFGIGATGFDPAFAEDRPGTYLLMKVIEDLCADPAVQTLDFGFGDAEYKRHFGDGSWVEEDVVVFEPRARPVALNLAGSALQGTTTAARAALEKVGGLSRLRRRRRAQVEGGS